MNEYQRRVLEGRKDFLKLQQQQEKELLKIYEEASKQVSYKLSKAKSGGLTNRYLNEIHKSINRYTLELKNNLSKSIKSGIEASSQVAANVQKGYTNEISPTQNIKSTFNKMFTQLPSNITKQLISGNYYSDGKTLDQRLWHITRRNAKDIDTVIKVNVAAGTNARSLARDLDSYINPKKKMKIHKRIPGINKDIAYQAQRLARTSLTHASTETYIQGSKMNPFNQGLKWNLSPSHFTRMHGKTDICDEYSGKIFKVDKYPISHPNCLCYATQANTPIEEARKELIDWVNGEENLKLDKWLEDYGEEFGINKIFSNKITIETKEEADLNKFIKNLFDKNKSKNKSKRKILLLKDLPKRDVDNITSIISKSPYEFQRLFLKYSDQIRFLDINNKTNQNYYSPKYNAICFNLKNDKVNIKGEYTTFFHELGHLIDKNTGRPSTNFELSLSFKNAIIRDVNNFIIGVKNNYNIKSKEQLCDVIHKELKRTKKHHSTSDIFSGVTMNKIYGISKHKIEYWGTKGSLERETFAHFFEATIRNDEVKLKIFRNILPNAYNIFIQLLKGV